MGKGDRRSRRGKIWRGSHGKTRPKKKSTAKTTKTTKSTKSTKSAKSARSRAR